MNPCLIILIVSLIFVAGCDNASDKKTSQGDKSSISAEARQEKTSVTDMRTVNKAIGSFYVQEGRFPYDLLELVEKKYIPRIPVLPEKATWDYDTNTGVAQIQK